MELSSKESFLMDQFYDKLAPGCTKWYSGASDKFASDVNDMKSTIDKIGSHKHVIMNYARDEFHQVKGSLFTIVDSLIDSQRAIETTD